MNSVTAIGEGKTVNILAAAASFAYDHSRPAGLSRSVMMSPRIACGATRNSIDLLFEGIPTSKGVISTYHRIMGAYANVLARG